MVVYCCLHLCFSPLYFCLHYPFLHLCLHFTSCLLHRHFPSPLNSFCFPSFQFNMSISVVCCFSLCSPVLCFTCNICLGTKLIISCGYISFSFYPFFSPGSPSTLAVSPPVLPCAVLKSSVHTHEHESQPSVSTSNRNTRNAFSPQALWSSGRCNMATISMPT